MACTASTPLEVFTVTTCLLARVASRPSWGLRRDPHKECGGLCTLPVTPVDLGRFAGLGTALPSP